MIAKAARSKIITQGEKLGVQCRCGTFTAFGAYGVAQMAKGNPIKYGCPCGNKISVKKAGASYSILETDAAL